MYSREKRNLIFMYIKSLLPVGVFIWSLFIAFIIVFSKFVFLSIFGRDFQSSLMPLVILIFGTSFAAIHSLLAGVLVAYKFTWAFTSASFIYIVVNLCGNMLLTKYFGILGAATASSLASIAYSLAILFEVRKRIHFKIFPVVLAILPAVIGFIIFILQRNFIYSLVITLITFSISIFFVKRFFVGPDLIYVLERLEVVPKRFINLLKSDR